MCCCKKYKLYLKYINNAIYRNIIFNFFCDFTTSHELQNRKKEHTEINKQQQNKMLIDPQNFIMGSQLNQPYLTFVSNGPETYFR